MNVIKNATLFSTTPCIISCQDIFCVSQMSTWSSIIASDVRSIVENEMAKNCPDIYLRDTLSSAYS